MSKFSASGRGLPPIPPSRENPDDGAFFTSVKPYFKNIVNSIKLPLGSIFYTTLSFVKKLTTENFRSKSLY